MKRRKSAVPGTAPDAASGDSLKPSIRLTSGRPSLLASGLLGFSDSLAPLDSSRTSLMTANGTEFNEDCVPQPSPTAKKLQSLARSVRAVQSLGTLKVRNKYLASTPMAAAGSGCSSRNLLQDFAAKPAKLPTRVVALPTNHFSTDEMKFRLDPLDATSAATVVHTQNASLAMIDASVTPVVTSPNHALLSARSTLNNYNGNNNTTATGKTRWKHAAAKTTLYEKKALASPRSQNNISDTGLTGSHLLRGAGGAGQRSRNRASSRGGSMTRDGISTHLTNPEVYPGGKPGSAGQRLASAHNIEARLWCARSLFKISCQSGSELAIIEGGAIGEIADLSDLDHSNLQELCAATLANLTSDVAVIDAFVNNDGISALLELSWSPAVPVKVACATALCRLSMIKRHVNTLMKAKCAIEFLSMLSIPHIPLQQLAIRCVVNIVFFGHSLPERVFVGEPHAIQSQAGVMSIINQLVAVSDTVQFAAEALFNLALHRVSCAVALRGGAAEILYNLAVQTCKSLDEHSGINRNVLLSQSGPPIPLNIATSLLRLIAATVANFSVHVEFHSIMNVFTMKTITMLLLSGLRDLGSRIHGAASEERLGLIASPCSRALANFSSNDDALRQFVTTDIISLATRLFLVQRSHLFELAQPHEEETFTRNMVRMIYNLSFNEACTAQFMEYNEVMPILSKILLPDHQHVNSDVSADESGDEYEFTDDEDGEDDDNYEGNSSRSVENDSIGSSHNQSTPQASRRISSRSRNSGMVEDLKEDILVTILNLGRQGPYSAEILKTVDGKLIATSANDPSHSRRLKYLYSVVLCNMLFETRLQQIVHGDTVVNALIDGFNFFPSYFGEEHGSPCLEDKSHEAVEYKSLNLAFPDDPERFFAAICSIAGELMDPRHVERVLRLCLNNLRPIEPSTPPALRLWRRQLACYAAATLHALARSSAQRGDTSSRTYTDETEEALISVCEKNASGCLRDFGDPNRANSTCSRTQAFCAATLYHVCASGHFNPRVIQALIIACNSNEETLSLLACAASFAIISFSPEGRQQLVDSINLARALNRLGRTSQVECQQYAAVAACNISTLACIWTSSELKDFIVVALLRANSVQAKQIHAKTLANLLSHSQTRPKIVEDGVLYALMKLSQFMLSPSGTVDAESTTSAAVTCDSSLDKPDPTREIFSLGLHVLFNLSCEYQYHSKLLGNGIMAYLVMANSGKPIIQSSVPGAPEAGTTRQTRQPAQVTENFYAIQRPTIAPVSPESRRYAMGIICNLSSYEENHQDLMNAQVTEIIRNYVDHDVESRASAAMAIRNLSCRQPWVEMICDRRTLYMLVVFTHSDQPVVRHFSIEALANCSHVTDSLHIFGELKVARAVLALLESTKLPIPSNILALASSAAPTDNLETSMAALKCLYNLASDDTLAQSVAEENPVLRLLPLLEMQPLGDSEQACFLAATTISVLADRFQCADKLLKQRVVSFCALLHRKHPHNIEIAYECSAILMKLSTYQQIQGSLVETQAIHVAVSICSAPCAQVDDRIIVCGAILIRNLTLSVADHLSVFYDETAFEEDTISGRGSGKESNALPTSLSCSDDVKVSRLAERHLIHGVKYLQQEIDNYQPETCCSPSKRAATNRLLFEACVAITNLSTIRVFRVAMVPIGVIPTLLRIFEFSQREGIVPAIVKSICSTTLHRLAMEDDAAVAGSSLLVPSLLDILQQSDEELHQVRYECEKVALLEGPGCAQSGNKITASARAVLTEYAHSVLQYQHQQPQHQVCAESSESVDESSPETTGTAPATTASTEINPKPTCVKQSYRESKWVVYVVKTSLSSSSMVPQMEKKQIRSIGLPKLSFFDAAGSLASQTTPYSGATLLRKSSSRRQTEGSSTPLSEPSASTQDTPDKPLWMHDRGYLLPTHHDKLLNVGGGPDATKTAAPLVNTIREGQDPDSAIHSIKFDRNMRLTRRTHRRNPSISPMLSL